MKQALASKRLLLVFVSIAALAIFFSRCVNEDAEQENITTTNYYGEKFAGSKACESCHKDVYESFAHTAHHLTTKPALKRFIKGSFNEGENVYEYNLYNRVLLQERDSGFYQVAYNRNTEKQAERFDIVIGSGVDGQSYLYWKGDRLFQLPVSYFTASNEWANSPGYEDYNADFSRPIYTRCLECHATYAKTLNDNRSLQGDRFDKANIIYGVECESCHGAAQKHVAYQSQHPDDKKAHFIINPASLTRKQQVDQCAFCHSGMQRSMQPAFSYVIGDSLSKFFSKASMPDSTATPDVHGNKYALLAASKCFKNSQTLTCTTCHNTHEVQRDVPQMFSAKCITCHQTNNDHFCKLTSLPASTLTKNCIDCHMPLKESKVLTVQLQDSSAQTAAAFRTHLIAVYPQDTQKLLTLLKHNK